MLYTMLLGIPAMFLHECGHISAALLCGVKVKKVGLCRTGLYTVREAGPRWSNLGISLAGPLVNLVLAIALRTAMPAFAWVNLIAFAYNLMPIRNSDGSRIIALLRYGTTAATASARPVQFRQSPV